MKLTVKLAFTLLLPSKPAGLEEKTRRILSQDAFLLGLWVEVLTVTNKKARFR